MHLGNLFVLNHFLFNVCLKNIILRFSELFTQWSFVKYRRICALIEVVPLSSITSLYAFAINHRICLLIDVSPFTLTINVLIMTLHVTFISFYP